MLYTPYTYDPVIYLLNICTHNQTTGKTRVELRNEYCLLIQVYKYVKSDLITYSVFPHYSLAVLTVILFYAHKD